MNLAQQKIENLHYVKCLRNRAFNSVQSVKMSIEVALETFSVVDVSNDYYKDVLSKMPHLYSLLCDRLLTIEKASDADRKSLIEETASLKKIWSELSDMNDLFDDIYLFVRD